MIYPEKVQGVNYRFCYLVIVFAAFLVHISKLIVPHPGTVFCALDCLCSSLSSNSASSKISLNLSIC